MFVNLATPDVMPMLPRPGAELQPLMRQADKAGENDEIRSKFEAVLGEMLFGQLFKAMRKTVGKPAYFHGGRAEEIFSQQLDQVLAQKIAETSADQFVGPMYDLFMMGRK